MNTPSRTASNRRANASARVCAATDRGLFAIGLMVSRAKRTDKRSYHPRHCAPRNAREVVEYSGRVTLASDARHRRTAYLAWIAVCVLWGTTYLGIRIALETIPPALVGALRYTAAGTLLTIILQARGEGMIAPSQWGGLALTGLLTICIGNGGVIWAEQWVPSGIAAVTVGT